MSEGRSLQADVNCCSRHHAVPEVAFPAGSALSPRHVHVRCHVRHRRVAGARGAGLPVHQRHGHCAARELHLRAVHQSGGVSIAVLRGRAPPAGAGCAGACAAPRPPAPPRGRRLAAGLRLLPGPRPRRQLPGEQRARRAHGGRLPLLLRRHLLLLPADVHLAAAHAPRDHAVRIRRASGDLSAVRAAHHKHHHLWNPVHATIQRQRREEVAAGGRRLGAARGERRLRVAAGRLLLRLHRVLLRRVPRPRARGPRAAGARPGGAVGHGGASAQAARRPIDAVKDVWWGRRGGGDGG